MGHSRTIELLKNPAGPRGRVAVGYCRRSTDRQEQSILDQRTAIDRTAHERSLAVVRIYIDDALTGTTTSRDIFEAARQLVQKRWKSRPELRERLNADIDVRHKPALSWTGYRVKFLLSGIMRCTQCGSRYQGRQDWSRSTRRYIYGCGGYLRCGRRVCALGPVPQVSLEEAVVAKVIEFYGRYTEAHGLRKIREALDSHANHSHRELSDRRGFLSAAMKKIDGTVANLLDNISAINRDLIDSRLVELRKQRQIAESELASLDQLGVSDAALEVFATETSAFIKQLSVVLKAGSPDARNVALRRCIAAMNVDAVAGHADMTLRIVPYIGIGSSYSATESVLVRWSDVEDHVVQRNTPAKACNSTLSEGRAP